MTKQIAIVMTSYNSGSHIEAQIDSIIQQSFSDWNLYISDDSSTDKTIAILKDYSQRFDNIHVQFNKTNVGVGKNFERGLRMVQDEEFVAPCDSDDIWLPKKLEKLIAYANTNNYSLIHHDAKLVDDNLKSLDSSLWDRLTRSGYAKNSILNPSISDLTERNTVSGPTMFFRSTINNKLLPFPDGIVQDYWIALAAATLGQVGSLDEKLILYRQHSTSLQGASTRNIKFYISRLTSKSFYNSYVLEAHNFKKIYGRLADLSNDLPGVVQSIASRTALYDIVLDINGMTKLHLIATLPHIVRRTFGLKNNYFTQVVLFMFLNKLIRLNTT